MVQTQTKSHLASIFDHFLHLEQFQRIQWKFKRKLHFRNSPQTFFDNFSNKSNILIINYYV